jgi:hypothetical protein
MIRTKVTYLNKEFVVEEEEPSTIPELVTLIGEEGLVTNTVANLRYRNKYPRVYKRVSLEVVKLGHAPQVKKYVPDKDGADKAIYEDDMDHIRSFLTKKPENKAILMSLFDRIAKEEPLFIRGDRAGGGGKIAQGALDAAHRYFAEGADKVTEVVETIERMLPGYHVARSMDDNGFTPESLARGIQTLQRHLVSKAKTVTSNL